jgi:hypothetical protein
VRKKLKVLSEPNLTNDIICAIAGKHCCKVLKLRSCFAYFKKKILYWILTILFVPPMTSQLHFPTPYILMGDIAGIAKSRSTSLLDRDSNNGKNFSTMQILRDLITPIKWP